MSDRGLEQSLRGLAPQNLDSARRRAKLVARARLARPGVDEAAATGTGRNRRLVFIGALAALVAGVAIAVGTGGGSAVHPEVASAAELTQIGASIPRLQAMGPWQIVNTESGPEEGSIEFRYEGPEGEKGIPVTGQSEIEWREGTIAEGGTELEAEGFTPAGPKPMRITRPEFELAGEWERVDDELSAQVYVANEGADGSFDAVGLWEEGGRTLAYRARVPDFYTLERLMERIVVLNEEQWLVALRPGGGTWLAETDEGTVQKAEKVKVGEKPNGDPIYSEGFTVGAAEPESLKKTIEDGFPTIIREGDTVRTVITRAPTSLQEP